MRPSRMLRRLARYRHVPRVVEFFSFSSAEPIRTVTTWDWIDRRTGQQVPAHIIRGQK